MALFRRSTEDSGPTSAPRTGSGSTRSGSPRSAGSTRLGARTPGKSRVTPAPEPTVTPVAPGARPAAKKDRPTPSRREAEAARRQRLHQKLTPKESRRLTSQQNREQRLRAMNVREATPEKELLRDYVDTRFNLGEFLLPSLVVILALSFFSAVYPAVTAITTLVMYLFIVAVLVDSWLLWRGFRRVLAQRLPDASTRGLMMYGINRAIQIRRFRLPPPRRKRGETY